MKFLEDEKEKFYLKFKGSGTKEVRKVNWNVK
jgi:hypothetical protein